MANWTLKPTNHGNQLFQALRKGHGAEHDRDLAVAAMAGSASQIQFSVNGLPEIMDLLDLACQDPVITLPRRRCAQALLGGVLAVAGCSQTALPSPSSSRLTVSITIDGHRTDIDNLDFGTCGVDRARVPVIGFGDGPAGPGNYALYGLVAASPPATVTRFISSGSTALPPDAAGISVEAGTGAPGIPGISNYDVVSGTISFEQEADGRIIWTVDAQLGTGGPHDVVGSIKGSFSCYSTDMLNPGASVGASIEPS